MRFYTKAECEQWLQESKRSLPDEMPELRQETFPYPSEPHRIFYIAHWLARNISCRMPVLLWITEWGIWPSTENWHLYRKLRQSYSNRQLLHEAPGHLFLEDETEDLASFLQLSMLNGWGGYLLAESNQVNAFFSHDEFITYYAACEKELDALRQVFKTKTSANSPS
jgi:hypothetical protein